MQSQPWDGLTDGVGSIGWRVTTSNGCSGWEQVAMSAGACSRTSPSLAAKRDGRIHWIAALIRSQAKQLI